MTFSSTVEKLLRRPEVVLCLLNQEGLKVKLPKYAFFQWEAQYLGHAFSVKGCPLTQVRLTYFIGQWQNWGTRAQTKGSVLLLRLGQKTVSVVLNCCKVSSHPYLWSDFSLPFVLEVVTSHGCFGAILSQEQSGKLWPIA